MGVAKSCLNLQYKPEIVTSLDFSRHQLEEVPANIFDYECTLEYLDLSSNSIADLPRHIFLCTGLKKLNISDNQLREIPEAISSLKELVFLNVAKNEISTIPSSISCCSKLEYLDLSSSFVTSIPDNSITNLIHLVELCLNDVYLEFLPANIGKLTNLRNLELRCNRMESLPLTLSKLKKLENLDIGANEFEEFPSVIGDLQNLKSLHIDENEIKKVPSAIGKLVCMEFLNADENKISEIDMNIGYCVNLKELHLEKNLLTQLPDSICSCYNLERLKISRNCLAELPNNLFELKSIFEMSMEHNNLQRLPNTIGILRNLNHLSVDYNYLKELPDEICSCSSLRILSLRENFINSLPANIGQLKQLKILNVINNNLTCLPLSINNIRSGLKALWLSDQQIKPLPSLQMIQSNDGSLNVLSCFMLPQSKFSSQSSEPAKVSDTSKQYNTDSMVRKKLLRFEKDVEEKSTTVSKKEKVEKVKHSLNRSPTPHPSELKKMANTAHHIASGTAQLKKTGGKTYRSYGKIDDVAVKSGELRGPVDFEIKEARVIDYLNEIDQIYSGKYSSESENLFPPKTPLKVTRSPESYSVTQPLITQYSNENIVGKYTARGDGNGMTNNYPDSSNNAVINSDYINQENRAPSPSNSNYFSDVQSNLYHTYSTTNSLRNESFDATIYDTALLPNRVPFVEKPVSGRRAPPPYQEACKYSKLTDADFLIYDSIRNLQKTNPKLGDGQNGRSQASAETAGSKEREALVNGNGNGVDVNGNPETLNGDGPPTQQSDDLVNNNQFTFTPSLNGKSFALKENQVTKELSIVISSDNDDFPSPPSPLPSVKENMNRKYFQNGEEVSTDNSFSNIKTRNSGQLSPTASNHSFVSNVSSSVTPRKKWAFGYHKNVSVSEVTVANKGHVPFEIFQKSNQGIFIKTVDAPFVKQLQANDKILECNGIDFLNITVESAKSILNQFINESDLKLMISR